MGVFSRLGDIVNSNLNAMLDRADDPEKMIRLVIQEMEDTLVEVRATAARTIAEKKELARKGERLAATAAEWAGKAELAVERGREDLARGALLEKARLEETGAALAAELAELDRALARHDEDVAKLEAKLAEAKAKQRALVAREQTVGAQLKVRRRLYDARVDEAFARFEAVERRLDDAEGEVEAFDLGARRTLADEIAELAAESRIADELAALKERVAGRKGRAGTD